MDEWFSSAKSYESVGESEGAFITLKVRFGSLFSLRGTVCGLKNEIKQTCSDYSESLLNLLCL